MLLRRVAAQARRSTADSHRRFPKLTPQLRLFYHARGPRAQAALVGERKTESNRAFPEQVHSLPSAKSVKLSDPLQRLEDEASGIVVNVYPTTVSVLSPEHGLLDEFHFHHVWLRDICTEETSVEKDTKQKLFHTSDIHIPSFSSQTGLLQGNRSASLVGREGALPTLRLTFSANHPVVNAFSAAFSSAPPSKAEPHISNIPIATLLEHAVPTLYDASHADIGGAARAWQASDFTAFPASPVPKREDEVRPSLQLEEGAAESPVRVSWSSLLGDDGIVQQSRFALVDGLMRDGIAFVTSLPTDKKGNVVDATDKNSPTLARLAEMLGEIRHTFYGSLWNVRSLGTSSRNIAYTNLDLGLHMDLCYFQNPPRFQFLHMLRNKVQGGASIFVDAYKVAEEIWTHHRDLWHALAEVPVGFYYQNDGRHYRYTHPTFEVASSTSGHAAAAKDLSNPDSMPRLTAINYSPPFQSPLPLHAARLSTEKLNNFYQALKLFADLTMEERFRYERTLFEGECVIFDNRRVLHSRRGFEWSGQEEASDDEVKRWLKGCYVDGDAIWSTYRTLLARTKGGKLGL